MRGTKVGIGFLVASGLVLAGCSGDGDEDGTTPQATSGSGSSAPEETASEDDGGGGEASSDLVSWAGNVCEAIGPFSERFGGLATMQPTDPSDLSGYVENVQQTFGSMGDLFDDASAAIESSGPPPIDGGEQIQAQVLAALETAGAEVEAVAAQLATIDPQAPDAMEQLGVMFETLLPAFEESMDSLDTELTTPEMDAAFDAAPECDGITDMGT